METDPRLGSGALIFGFAQAVYPLSMTFLQGGKTLSSIPFDVQDMHGHVVFSATSDRAYTVLRLPAGDYRVSARMNGTTVRHDVEVGPAGDAHLLFDWSEPKQTEAH